MDTFFAQVGGFVTKVFKTIFTVIYEGLQKSPLFQNQTEEQLVQSAANAAAYGQQDELSAAEIAQLNLMSVSFIRSEEQVREAEVLFEMISVYHTQPVEVIQIVQSYQQGILLVQNLGDWLYERFYDEPKRFVAGYLIERKYPVYFGILGDGNCFYRAVMIGYLFALFQSSTHFKRIFPLIQDLHHNRIPLLKMKRNNVEFNSPSVKNILIYNLLQFYIERQQIVDQYNDDPIRLQLFLMKLIDTISTNKNLDFSLIVLCRSLIFATLNNQQSQNLRNFIPEEMIEPTNQLLCDYNEYAESLVISLTAEALNIPVQIISQKSYKHEVFYWDDTDYYYPSNYNPNENNVTVHLILADVHYDLLMNFEIGSKYFIEYLIFNQIEHLKFSLLTLTSPQNKPKEFTDFYTQIQDSIPGFFEYQIEMQQNIQPERIKRTQNYEKIQMICQESRLRLSKGRDQFTGRYFFTSEIKSLNNSIQNQIHPKKYFSQPSELTQKYLFLNEMLLDDLIPTENKQKIFNEKYIKKYFDHPIEESQHKGKNFTLSEPSHLGNHFFHTYNSYPELIAAGCQKMLEFPVHFSVLTDSNSFYRSFIVGYLLQVSSCQEFFTDYCELLEGIASSGTTGIEFIDFISYNNSKEIHPQNVVPLLMQNLLKWYLDLMNIYKSSLGFEIQGNISQFLREMATQISLNYELDLALVILCRAKICQDISHSLFFTDQQKQMYINQISDFVNNECDPAISSASNAFNIKLTIQTHKLLAKEICTFKQSQYEPLNFPKKSNPKRVITLLLHNKFYEILLNQEISNEYFSELKFIRKNELVQVLNNLIKKHAKVKHVDLYQKSLKEIQSLDDDRIDQSIQYLMSFLNKKNINETQNLRRDPVFPSQEENKQDEGLKDIPNKPFHVEIKPNNPPKEATMAPNSYSKNLNPFPKKIQNPPALLNQQVNPFPPKFLPNQQSTSAQNPFQNKPQKEFQIVIKPKEAVNMMERLIEFDQFLRKEYNPPFNQEVGKQENASNQQQFNEGIKQEQQKNKQIQQSNNPKYLNNPKLSMSLIVSKIKQSQSKIIGQSQSKIEMRSIISQKCEHVCISKMTVIITCCSNKFEICQECYFQQKSNFICNDCANSIHSNNNWNQISAKCSYFCKTCNPFKKKMNIFLIQNKLFCSTCHIQNE